MRIFILGLLLAGCAPVATVSVVPSASPSVAIATEVTSMSDPVPAGKFLFFEDFENGTDKWNVGADGWRLLNAFTCGGQYTMLLPDTGKPGESFLTLKQPLDLTRALKPVLKYDVKGLSTPSEAVWVQAEIQPKGGEWRPIGRDVRGDHVFVASVVCDLTPYAAQQMGLRFHGMTRAGAGNAKGMYLDDIQVIEPQ